LHLKESCLHSLTLILRTLHLRLLRIVPRALPAKNILAHLLREDLTLIVALLHDELIGAAVTFEAVVCLSLVGRRRGDSEDVGAGGAKE